MMRMVAITLLVIALAAGSLSHAAIDVTLTQACLASLGFPVGPIDGKIGPQTIRAYLAWERSRFGALAPLVSTARKAERLAAECMIDLPPQAAW